MFAEFASCCLWNDGGVFSCVGSAQGGMPERIIFRTGEYRLTDDVQEYKSGDDFKPGWDEPGADDPVAAALIYIDDVKAR